MNSKWTEAAPSQFEAGISELVYATRLLQQEADFGFLPGALTSAKMPVPNILGDEQEVMVVLHSHPENTAGAGDFTALRTGMLVGLACLETLPLEDLVNTLACSRILAAAPVPPPAALIHALLPYRCILSAQPAVVLAIACSPRGEQMLRQTWGEEVLYLPFSRPGLPAAKACARAFLSADKTKLAGIYLHGYGLMTFGETARIAYERLVDLVGRAAASLENLESRYQPDPTAGGMDQTIGQKLAALRKAVSLAAGTPLILTRKLQPEGMILADQTDPAQHSRTNPAIAEHVTWLKRLPMFGQDLDAYTAGYRQAFAEEGMETLPPGLDPAPRVVLDPELGLCTMGRTAGEARQAMKLFQHTAGIYLHAMALGGYQAFSTGELVQAEVLHAEISAAEIALTHPEWRDELEPLMAPFTGEVALVTGGASGIGKACVESLLKRGAAVVSLDINPTVTSLFDRDSYMGLECDLTDEAAILACFETTAREFGGLDMLVLNAGVFPAGCRIESLSLEEWQRVMRINLDSNLVILREGHTLLKQSPFGGRVLVNASKNVLAPGAGAAAYSASKAAVTQMARVAALEWGKDGIRVNMIHPDAIFDTGIWTEDVLKARAAHYGLTVQQYKTRNVLGVELNSHYVAELVAEMLGSRFAKITGAQIPVDGGSDRVI